MKRLNTRLLAVTATTSFILGGCGGDMSDLKQWVADEKAKPVRVLIEIPEVKPPAKHVYSAESERSPFVATVNNSIDDPNSSTPGPDPNRNREHLEKFSLDSLRMVGSLNTGEFSSALVQDSEGLIHRVRPGNYLGENYGRVISINDSSIELIELVRNGLDGGWAEREAAIGLSD